MAKLYYKDNIIHGGNNTTICGSTLSLENLNELQQGITKLMDFADDSVYTKKAIARKCPEDSQDQLVGDLLARDRAHSMALSEALAGTDKATKAAQNIIHSLNLLQDKLLLEQRRTRNEIYSLKKDDDFVKKIHRSKKRLK